MVEDEWGQTVSLEKVEQAIAENSDARVVAFVHAETSTGAFSDAASICKLASSHGMLSIVDTVTSLGGIELKVGEWGADAVYSGTQKCLSCVPGISPVTFSDKAVERIRSRKTKVQSWFLDMQLVMGYWGQNTKRAYHHRTSQQPLCIARVIADVARRRTGKCLAAARLRHQALAAGLEAMGLGLVVEQKWRLPQLNSVTVPTGVDELRCTALLRDFNLEIGAGLVPWRVKYGVLA